MKCGPDGVLGILSNCGLPAEGPRCEMDFGCGREQECCRERYGSSVSESDTDARQPSLSPSSPTPPTPPKEDEEAIKPSVTENSNSKPLILKDTPFGPI